MANEMKFGNKVVFLGGYPVSLPVRAADPSSGSVAGDMYFNSSGVVKYYTGSAWVTFTTGSVSLTGQALAEGSIIVGNSSTLSAAVDTIAAGDVLAATTSSLTIKANAVGAAKVRLENNTALRARNFADSGDVKSKRFHN